MNIECIENLTGHNDYIFDTCVYQDNLISASWDGTIKFWDLKTLKCIKTLTGHTGFIYALCIYKNYLISGGWDTMIKIWDIDTLECIKTIKNFNTIRKLCIYQDILFCGTFDTIIKVWDLNIFECINTLKIHCSSVNNLEIYKNYLISASNETINILDLEKFKTVKEIKNKYFVKDYYKISLSNFCISNNLLIFNKKDYRINIFNLDSFKYVAKIKTNEIFYKLCVYHNYLVSEDLNRDINITDLKNFETLENFEPLKKFQGHCNSITTLKIHQDYIISGSSDKKIKISGDKNLINLRNEYNSLKEIYIPFSNFEYSNRELFLIETCLRSFLLEETFINLSNYIK